MADYAFGSNPPYSLLLLSMRLRGHFDRSAVPHPATIDFDGLNAVCV
jgi:hypothetical protein